MRANTVMPFALTAASSLFIVSFGPWLLRMVFRPSAAIACTPQRHISAVRAKIVVLVRRPPPLVSWHSTVGASKRDAADSFGLHLHRCSKLPGGAGNDHQIASLRLVGAPHDLTYRSDGVDDRRSRRIGHEGCQRLDRFGAVRLRG